VIAALLGGLALTVSPAHAVLTAPASRTIDVRNTGAATVEVAVKSPPTQLLRVRPTRIALRPGSHRLLTARVRASARARAGDHELLVVLLAQPLERSGVAVRMRIGVRLRVRVPGRLVRHIALLGLHVRRHPRPRLLLVSVANAGNVTEPLRGRVTITLVRRGRVISRLRYVGSRELAPGSRVVIPLRYRGGAHGRLNALVRVGQVVRAYALRL
jgi:hypothetical protein